MDTPKSGAPNLVSHLLKVQKLQAKGIFQAAAIKAMSSAQYAASSKKKREDTAKGKQFSKQPKAATLRIAKRYR